MAGNSRIKQLSLLVLAGFYVFAGANHFINPQFYLPLIPQYFLYPELINIVSGVVEILFGIGLLIPRTRFWSAWGIVLMLIAFIPSHVYFIQVGSCAGELCIDPWIGWARLLIIHPLLIGWAYWHRR